MRRLLLLFVGVLARRHRHGDLSRDTLETSKAVPFGGQYHDEKLGMVAGHNDPAEDLENPPIPTTDKKYFSKHHNPNNFASPRDAYILKSKQAANVSDDDAPLIFDFAKILEENIFRRNIEREESRLERFRNPFRSTAKPKPKPKSEAKAEEVRTRWLDDVNDHSKDRYFQRTSFDIIEDVNFDGKITVNWTTCEEFAKDASFHPDDIVNIDWVPFFVWSFSAMFGAVHKFEIPTVKLVETYREKYGPFINFTVNWNEPKLLMRAASEMLLIALDRTGLFLAIPKHEIPEGIRGSSIVIPTLTLRLKIVDPYLALLYCNTVNPYAAIMAVSGQEPSTIQEKILEAKTLKFQGPGIPVSRDSVFEQAMQNTSESLQDDKKYINAEEGLFSKDEYDKVQKDIQDHEIEEVRFYL